MAKKRSPENNYSESWILWQEDFCVFKVLHTNHGSSPSQEPDKKQEGMLLAGNNSCEKESFLLVILDDNSPPRALLEGLQSMREQYGQIRDVIHVETLKELFKRMGDKKEDERIILVSDTLLGPFTDVVSDFLSAWEPHKIREFLAAFMLYTKNELARTDHDHIDGRIKTLEELYLGRYHRDQSDKMLHRLKTHLDAGQSGACHGAACTA